LFSPAKAQAYWCNSSGSARYYAAIQANGPESVIWGLDDKLLDVKLPPSSWREDQDPANQRDSFPKPLVSPLEGRRGSLNGIQYESGLFSSSLPDIFDKKSEPSYFVSYVLFD